MHYLIYLTSFIHVLLPASTADILLVVNCAYIGGLDTDDVLVPDALDCADAIELLLSDATLPLLPPMLILFTVAIRVSTVSLVVPM